MTDHGGNLDVAIRRFGGRLEDWIDLSTGINRQPYPVGQLQPRSWAALPSHAEIESLHDAARCAYGTTAPVLAVAGAQAAIQMLPQLAQPGCARILAPTYNEYAPVLAAAGWQVEEAGDLDALAGADLAIVVNPNNPDGQRHDVKDAACAVIARETPHRRRELCRCRARRVAGGRSGEAGPVDPALFRQVLRARRIAARLRLGLRGGCRRAGGDGWTLAGLGRGGRDRTARAARPRLGGCDKRTPRMRSRAARYAGAERELEGHRRHIAVSTL